MPINPRAQFTTNDPQSLKEELAAFRDEVFGALAALGRGRVRASSGDTVFADYNDLVRLDPGTAGQTLVLPKPDKARASARVAALITSDDGAVSVEVLDGTINGEDTLTFRAAVGLVEFVLDGVDGWYCVRAAFAGEVGIAQLEDITGPAVLGRVTGTGAVALLTGAETGHLIKRGVFTTATLSADQNDWSPTNLAATDLLTLSVTGANRTVTGIDTSVFAVLSGTWLVLRNSRTTTFTATLTHNSGSSLAANRFICPNGTSYVLQPGESALLWYGATGAGTGWQVMPWGARLTGPEIADVIRGSGANLTVTGTINNWAPAGASTTNWFRLTLTGATTITGLDATIFNTLGELANGRELLLFNIDTTDTLTLANLSASSTASNRFSCPGGSDLLVPPGGIVKLLVDTNAGHVKVVPYALPGADDTMLVNISGGTAVHQPRSLASMVAGGLTYDATNHTWKWDGTTQLIPDGDKGEVSVVGSTWTVDADITKTWTGTHTFNAAASFAHDVRLNGVISPTITADQNDWNPTGLAGCGVVRCEVDATPRTVTGIVPPSDNGHLRLFCNSGSANLTLAHQSASSTAENRIICPNSASLTLSVNDAVWGWYDFASNRWRLVGT